MTSVRSSASGLLEGVAMLSGAVAIFGAAEMLVAMHTGAELLVGTRTVVSFFAAMVGFTIAAWGLEAST